MKKYLPFILAIILLSCSSSKSNLPESSFYDTEWQLASILLADGSKKLFVSATTLDIPPVLTIAKERNRVTGSSGCNRFTSSVNVEGFTIKFDQLAMTRMLCMNDNGLETAIVKALGIVNNYSIKKGRLLLKQDKKIIAEYIIKGTKEVEE